LPTLDNLKLTLTWKQIVTGVMALAGAIAGYYGLKGEIREAMDSPRPPVTEEQFLWKTGANATHIDYIQKELEEIDERLDKLEENE